MKKLIFLLSMVFFIPSDINAMRRRNKKIIEQKKKNNFINSQQVLYNSKNTILQVCSFNEVWKTYNTGNKAKKRYLDNSLSQSLLFSFAKCPQEIRHKILTIMFDNDTISAQEFDTKPILSVFKHYNYAKAYAPLKISNRSYSLSVLFRCSKREIDQIYEISQPFTYIEEMIGSENSIVPEKGLKNIQSMKAEITQHLKVKVVRDEYVDDRLRGPAAMCAISLLAWPFLSYPAAIGFTCCLEGMFSVLYYRRASLDAIDVEFK